MKVLILGANGMAGHTISIYLTERGHDTTAFTRKSFPYCKNNITGDVQDQSLLYGVISEGEYDYIINCVGVLNSAAENNPSQAVYLNSYLPHFVADTIRETPTRMIQMSTDCVFAGNTGPYSEDSLTDGRTFYDRTKAMGEVVDDRNLTFRNSIIGPDMNPEGIGLFNWFMKQKGTVRGYTGAIWTGVTTLTLAKAMERAMEEGLTGIYNLVNDQSISKYDLLGLFNTYMRDGLVDIQPDGLLRLDKTLVNTRSSEFSFSVPSYEEMVADMKRWVEDHAELYKHYRWKS